MARKQGGVSKFLNFIGLVDDDTAQRAPADDGYGDGYGRPSTYVPRQQRSRTEDTRRRTIVKDERGRYGADHYSSTRGAYARLAAFLFRRIRLYAARALPLQRL